MASTIYTFKIVTTGQQVTEPFDHFAGLDRICRYGRDLADHYGSDIEIHGSICGHIDTVHPRARVTAPSSGGMRFSVVDETNPAEVAAWNQAARAVTN